MASSVEVTDLNSLVERLDAEDALLDSDGVGNEDAVEVDAVNEGSAETQKPSSSMEVDGSEKEPKKEPESGSPNESANESLKGKESAKVSLKGFAKGSRSPRIRNGRGGPGKSGPPTPGGRKSLTIKARGKVLEMSGHFVWLSNLPYETTWKDLKDLIRKKGALHLFPGPRILASTSFWC